MPCSRSRSKKTLAERYPPSPQCSCEICLSYCQRPGWWTVKESARAIIAGYAARIMLEMSPDLTFGVLSPAFAGCETDFADNRFAANGCNFLKYNLCELFGTGVQPLECRYCHHDRPGLSPQCHAELEKDWNTSLGQPLVVRWAKLTGFWDRLESIRSKLT